jgi:predicted transcriptional regulator
MSTITNFPITVYGKMEKFSDTISKGRCRVFYKGRNRNGTYITDEFAQKLINSAPYTPVKGIYDYDDGDYTDHGQKRSEGRIYGIVPANPNFAWEPYPDDEGVVREYACFDVLYYTALYKEAGQIEGKGESMELFRDTLKGDWKIMDGKKTYVFTDGCFLGLQALGDDVEPCFEGASFYQKQDEAQEDTEANIIALLEKYEKKIDLFQNHEQGGNTMPNITFKISDGQKYDFLFNLLNPNFNEEGNWVVEYSICEVYEDYAIVRNLPEGIYERVYFTKDDEKDSLEITNKERCYIVDVNESEKAALDSLRGEGTYAQVVETMTEKDNTINSLNENINTLNENVEGLNQQISELNGTVENLTESNSNFSTQIEELNNTISTLTIERDEANSNYTASQASFEELNNNYNELNTTLAEVTVERDALITYKKTVEDNAKKAIIGNYVEDLDATIIETYMNNLDNYSAEELDMKLTYEQKKANPGLFSKTPAPTPAYLPKDDNCDRSINDILSRYERQ